MTVRVRSSSSIQHTVFDPLRWIVPDLLPEGFTLFIGKPKAGKSWMALDLAIAVATGGKFLDRDCEQGDVLGMFLEDTKRRIQGRMTSMIGIEKVKWPSCLMLATEWPRLDDGGLDMIRDWVLSVKKPRLVIVDILEKVRPSENGKKTLYANDYAAVTELQKLAGELQISILVIHHQRKAGADNLMDTISGTGGLGGGCDAIMLLGDD